MQTPRKPFSTGAVIGLVLSLAGAARAVEQPISGKKLVLRRTLQRSSLTFLSKDPAFLLPTPGGPDDPRTAGLTIELAGTAEHAILAIPPGATGWTVRTGAITKYKFHDRAQPLKAALLQQGRPVRVTAPDAGLALAAPQGAVLVQIATGSLKDCALFDAPVVDQPGRFVARDAAAPPACPAASTTTTTTAPPTCSGQGAICNLTGGCCPGLECSLLGGPGAGSIGTCVGSCASREGAICGSSLPGSHPVACCPEQYCVVQFGPGGFPVVGTCQSTPPPLRCCQYGPGANCADIQENLCVGPFSPAAPDTVCDGATGTCSAVRSGDSGCCDVPNLFPFERCFEGPDAEASCAALSGATYHAGYRCKGGCAPP